MNSEHVTTSYLVSNLHCPSCVSHIQDTLSSLDPPPTSISPSLVTSWVTVQHPPLLSTRKIQEALEEAGFEVSNTLPDDNTTYHGSQALPKNGDKTGYLDRFLSRWEEPDEQGKAKELKSRHVEHCESCQSGLEKHRMSKSGDATHGQPKLDLSLVTIESQQDEIWRATIAVGGMTCASCASAITEELGKKGWVKDCTVNLIANSATIDFTGEHHKDEIVECIEDIGYDAAIDTVVDVKTLERVTSRSGARTVDILLEGMFCGHCPPRVVTAMDSYGGRIVVEKEPTLHDPILRIRYTPELPHFTIRAIIATLTNLSSLKASIYHPPTIEERSRKLHARERVRIFVRVLVTLVIAIPTFIIGIVYMSLVPSTNSGRKFLDKPLSAGVSRTQWALFVLATPVYFLCADVFHLRALKELRTLWKPNSTVPILQRFYRYGSMNMLMSLGTSIAYISSVAQLINAAVHPMSMADDGMFYFDSVVFLTLFLLTGRLIEAYSKAKTGDAIVLLSKLRPSEALLISGARSSTTNEDSLTHIPIELLEHGDIVKVLHGGSPPCDGIIVDGTTTFDESSLTGESRPVKKVPQDEVFSGTINKGSPVSISITGLGGTSLLDQIVSAVRSGQTKRAPIERIADSLTAYFVPLITFLAIITFLVWLSLGYSDTLPASYKGDNESWAAWSLQFSIAVFVVACPCGLALAAPTALFVGGGLAAKHGILVKGGGEAFEKASQLDVVVFDKTGTLTVGGEPSVTDLEIFPSAKVDRASILGLVKAIEENSSHTVAKAIVSLCNSRETTALVVGEVTEIPGYGMQGTFSTPSNDPSACSSKTEQPNSNITMIVGNEALMTRDVATIPAATQTILETYKCSGRSVALAAIKSSLDTSYTLVAIFAVSDPLRPEASSIISALRAGGTQVYMLSGDNQITAEAIGREVGINLENIIAGVLPSQKSDHIQRLQRIGGGRRIVAMVGDGINDAPALTTADVGIAIGSGSEIAISSAEFVLITSNLHSLLTLLDLSKVVFRRVKLNFGWALVYNLVALPVAAGVLYPVVSNGTHVRLDPVWASLAMAASSISVVCSSLLLRSGWWGVGFRVRTGQ